MLQLPLSTTLGCGPCGEARVSRLSRRSSPVPRLGDESPASLHLHVQASLHAAHLHVLVQVPVHVVLGRGQLQLREGTGAEMSPGHGAEQGKGGTARPVAAAPPRYQ